MDIQRKDWAVASCDGQHRLHCVTWCDGSAKPKAVLQLVHGMCEYIGRYDALARFLAGHGFAVCGHDHLGHGQTAQSSEELGFFAEKDGWRLLVEDVYRVTLAAKEQYAGLPYFIFGHSMGSFVLENYPAQYGSEVDGAIVCGTGGPNPAGGVGIALAGLYAAVKGPRYRAALFDKMAFGSYCSRIESPRTDKDWLTRDEAVVDAYRTDEHCMFLFTVSAFRDLFTLLKNATRRQWPDEVPDTLPLLYVAGDCDPVGSYGKGVAAMVERLRRSGKKDLTMRLYEGMRHEITNEIGREQVYEELLAWLEAHMPAKAE